ncbi:MAG: ABC transporter permease, partial [Thermoleophilia bacterium]|nr:ABC transporter permease [Thermoleophilia bacterium]
SFDLRRLFEEAAEVELVAMDEAEAARRLETGRVLAVLTVPGDFTSKLRRLRESPRLVLRTAEGALGSRVAEKMRALVYGINLRLQQAYIEANLGYVELLRRGGTGTIGRERLTVLGLERARAELDRLSRSPDPDAAARARELAAFIRQVEGAVAQVGDFLRATANPIALEHESRAGRTWALSAQVQAYALALSLAFVALLLGAAAITVEREERTFGRLVRGLVSLRALVVEKVLLVATVAAAVAVVLVCGFGLVVELTGVRGGQPWERLPLLVAGLALAAACFGAIGVLAGGLARNPGAAMLVALLIGLPLVLAGIVPAGASIATDALRAVVPFASAVELASAALYDVDPWPRVAAEAGRLLLLALGFGALARAAVPRLLG